MTNYSQRPPQDLEQVLMALEDAWERERNAGVVDALAKKYPAFADDLYDYFDSLLESEIRPQAETAIDDGAVEAIRKWLQSEGRELARRLATEERHALARERGTSTPTAAGIQSPDAGRTRNAPRPPSTEPGAAPESLIGYLKRAAGRSIVELAGQLHATPAFLRLVVAHSSVIPDVVNLELARLASARLGVPGTEVLEHLSQRGSYPVAASRDQPYAIRAMTFDEVLEVSDLSDEQRHFWTDVAKGGPPDEGRR